MYCPKCKVDVGNMNFCENCGAATVGDIENEKSAISGAAEEMAATAEMKAPGAGINIKVPEFSLKNLVAIGVAVVLLIASIFGYSTLKANSTPESTAERYANCLIAGDSDKAFALLDIQDDEFLSKANFKKYIDSLELKDKKLVQVRAAEQMNQLYGMFGQDQQKDSTLKPEQIKHFEIQIDTDVYGLTLVQKGKSFGIFKGWKILASDFSEKWQIVAPKGSKVSVNGVLIERIDKTQEVGTWGFGNQSYMPVSLTFGIEAIFPGQYEITATLPGAEDFKTVANAGTLTNINFVPSDATIKELHQVAKQFLELGYAKAEKDKYTGILSPDSSLMQQEKIIITGGYYGLFNTTDTSTYELKEVSIIDNTGIIDDEAHAKLQVQAKYNVTSDEYISWFSSETKKVTKEQTSSFNMSFVKKDGKWILLEPGTSF